MKQWIAGVVMAGMAATAMGDTPMSADMKNKMKEELAIRQTFKDLEGAFNKKDAKAISMMFTEDGDVINPAGLKAQGRANIEKLVMGDIEHLMKDGKNTFRVNHIRHVKPDVAVVTGMHEISGVTGPDGKPLPAMKVTVTCVLQKTGEKWMCVVARPMVPIMPPASAKVDHKK